MPLADEQERISVRLELPRSVVEAVILATRQDDLDRAGERERLARIILKNRQRRHNSFPSISFGEPGWDMLLQLYIADCAGQAIDVSSLCASTGVPKTSALRHLNMMEGNGLVRRCDDSADGRRIFVNLNDALRSQTEDWLDGASLSLAVGPP